MRWLDPGLFQPSANSPSLNKTAVNIKEVKMKQSPRLKAANDITIKSCKLKLARRKISYIKDCGYLNHVLIQVYVAKLCSNKPGDGFTKSS